MALIAGVMVGAQVNNHLKHDGTVHLLSPGGSDLGVLFKVCDSKNNTAIYVSRVYSGGSGLAILPGGCK